MKPGATFSIRTPGQYRPTPIHWPRNTPERMKQAAMWRRLRREGGGLVARKLWRHLGAQADALAARWDAEIMRGGSASAWPPVK